jgi:hypothetical protein
VAPRSCRPIYGIKTFRPIRNATAINAATKRKNSIKVLKSFYNGIMLRKIREFIKIDPELAPMAMLVFGVAAYRRFT